MTENGAKKKWCPVAGYRPDGSAGQFEERCLASMCMAWRWEFLDDGSVRKIRPYVDKAKTKLGPAETSGYCGLAGRLAYR